MASGGAAVRQSGGVVDLLSPGRPLHSARVDPALVQAEVDQFLGLSQSTPSSAVAPAAVAVNVTTTSEQQDAATEAAATTTKPFSELPFNAAAAVVFAVPEAANRVLRLAAQFHQAPAFRSLSVLRLGGCSHLSDETAVTLLTAFPLVIDLDLSGCTQLTVNTLQAIARCVPHVQILELAGLKQFTDEELAECVLLLSFCIDISDMCSCEIACCQICESVAGGYNFCRRRR